MKTFYCVETRFYDNGKIKARMFSREAETIPANKETETAEVDIYTDWFKNETVAKKFLAEARVA